MQVKIFQIRISDNFQKSDENLVRNFVSRCQILRIETQLVREEINYWSVLIFYNEINDLTKANNLDNIVNSKFTIRQFHKYNPKDNIEINEKLNIIGQPSTVELMIYNKLKKWREEKARKSNSPVYIILQNSHLMSMARHLPRNLEDLENINGVGKPEIEKFGREILTILENILNENLQ